jgi:hypothetical protein
MTDHDDPMAPARGIFLACALGGMFTIGFVLGWLV